MVSKLLSLAKTFMRTSKSARHVLDHIMNLIKSSKFHEFSRNQSDDKIGKKFLGYFFLFSACLEQVQINSPNKFQSARDRFINVDVSILLAFFLLHENDDSIFAIRDFGEMRHHDVI